MAETDLYETLVNKVIRYLETKPILGMVQLDALYRSAANDQQGRRHVYNFLTRACIGRPAAERNPIDAFYAIYLPLLDEPLINVYLALPGIPKSIVKLEDPTCTAINELKEHLSERYGADYVEFWLQAAQNHTVRLAARAMRTARRRDMERCILCQHVNLLRRKEGLKPVRSSSSRRIASHVISRRSVFWNEVARIDSEHDLFSPDGTTALYSALKDNVFISDPGHIVLLCHEHDLLLVRTIRDFARELA